jgi:hypothetical protein
VAVEPVPTLLNEFMSLADAPPEAILMFAERYGVLGLSMRGLPLFRPGRMTVVGAIASRLARTPYGAFLTAEGEPIAAWRYFARQARAILDVAATLVDDRPADDGLWRRVLGRPDWPVDTAPPRIRTSSEILGRLALGDHLEQMLSDVGSDVEAQRHSLCAIVNEWLELGAVEPRVFWIPEWDRARIVIPYYGLFGALADQLSRALSSPRSSVRCSYCGSPCPEGRTAGAGRGRVSKPGENACCGALICRRSNASERQRRRRQRLGRPATNPGR